MSEENPLLRYEKRGYGMDHDRYDWSMINDRPKLHWPGDKKVALWVNVSLQFFPLAQHDKTFPVPGGMRMPYPDLRHFSLRDYGNRVGIYRVLRVLERHGISPTIAMNADVARYYPTLCDRVVERGYEVIAHGVNMDSLHHSEVPVEVEATRIKETLALLREATGQPVKGWLSPGKSQSFQTPDLLAAGGIAYMCDWVNDTLPYSFRTAHGALTAMPLSTELEDTFILGTNLHSVESYREQVSDAMSFLLSEAEEKGGRLLALSVHPWLIGQPHRIRTFERMIADLVSREGVWRTTSGEILAELPRASQ